MVIIRFKSIIQVPGTFRRWFVTRAGERAKKRVPLSPKVVVCRIICTLPPVLLLSHCHFHGFVGVDDAVAHSVIWIAGGDAAGQRAVIG